MFPDKNFQIYNDNLLKHSGFNLIAKYCKPIFDTGKTILNIKKIGEY